MNLITALNLQLTPATPDVVAFVGAAGKTTTLLRLSAEIVAQGGRVVATSTCQMSAAKAARFPAVVRVTDEHLPFVELAETLETHGQCLLIGPTFESKSGPKAAAVACAIVEQVVAQAASLNIGAILVEADGSRQRAVKAPSDREPVVPASTKLLVPIVGFDAMGRMLNEENAHRPERLRAVLGLPTASAPDDSAPENDTIANGAAARLTPAMVARLVVHPAGGAKDLPEHARLLPMLNRVDDAVGVAAARLVAQQLTALGEPCLISRVGVAEAAPIRERWAPAAVVVLVAGESRRMGRPKQLEVVDGEAMVVRAVRVALQSGAQQVLVVTGAYAEQVSAALAPLCEQTPSRVQFAHNAAWRTGQASSVRVAVEKLPTCADVALFMPVDQPYLEPALLRGLLQLWRNGARLAAPLVDGQVRGAPALFERSLWSQLLVLEGDAGARSLLQQYRTEVATISTIPYIVRDIDSPADLADH